MKTWSLVTLTALCAAACGNTATTASSTSSSSGNNAAEDGGTPDAAVEIPDAGTADAAVGPVDDGPGFSSECGAPATLDIFSPLGPAPVLPADKGKLLGCVTARTFTAAQLQANEWIGYVNLTVKGGAREYIMQYVSEGPTDTARRVTAVVMLPTDVAPPYPVIAFNHGTTGMGPNCGISRDRFAFDYLALPFVSQGYAVVATDYANLGVPDGVSPYAVGEGSAQNVLDAVRATLDLDAQAEGGPMLGTELFIAGHSQGGHASFFAHQLAETQPVQGMELLGTIPIAPAFGIPYGLAAVVAGNTPTDGWTSFSTIIFYAHAWYAGVDPSTWLQPDFAAEYPQLMNTLCSADLNAAIQQRWPNRADLFQDSFRQAAATCALDGTACPQFEPWATLLYASTPGYFESDVPILIVVGGQDQIVTEFSVACTQTALRNRNNNVRSCKYPAGDHYTVGIIAMGDMLEWMEARRSGLNPDVCDVEVSTVCAVN